MKRIFPVSILVILSILTAFACSDKYRLLFYRIDEGRKLELTHEDSYYIQGFIISNRPEQNLIVPGRGQLLVTNQSALNPEQKNVPSGLLTTEGRITYRIVVPLPDVIATDSINMGGISVCQVLGRYHVADSLNIYRCREGFLRIDRAKGSSFHAILSGNYYNIQNDSLTFSGEIKAKRRK